MDIFKNYEGSEDQPPNYDGFVVIGAGLPRTGTMSTRAALGILLEGACYHMTNVGKGTQADVDHWERALQGKVTKEEWVEFLEGRGFRAGVDFPISMFYRELMDAFPNAKVLLTVRNPDTWYDSVKDSILKVSRSAAKFPLSWLTALIGRSENIRMVTKISDAAPRGFKKGMFPTVESSKEETVAFFNKWVEEVKATVPKDRLLIFECKQGWAPLCEFLGVPIPDQPFPRVNDTAQMNSMLKSGTRMAYGIFVVLPVVLSIAAAYFFKDRMLEYVH